MAEVFRKFAALRHGCFVLKSHGSSLKKVIVEWDQAALACTFQTSQGLLT